MMVNEERWVQSAVRVTFFVLSVLMLMVVAYFWGAWALAVAFGYGVSLVAYDRESRAKD